MLLGSYQRPPQSPNASQVREMSSRKSITSQSPPPPPSLAPSPLATSATIMAGGEPASLPASTVVWLVVRPGDGRWEAAPPPVLSPRGELRWGRAGDEARPGGRGGEARGRRGAWPHPRRSSRCGGRADGVVPGKGRGQGSVG